MRISDWSSDVCSSDLGCRDGAGPGAGAPEGHHRQQGEDQGEEAGQVTQGGGAGDAEQRRQHHGCLEEIDLAGKVAEGQEEALKNTSKRSRTTSETRLGGKERGSNSIPRGMQDNLQNE